MEAVVWAEKYRPKSLKDVINQRHAIERIKAFVKERNIPHMLFAGPAGCGKTATALSLAQDLYGKVWRQNVLELNASDERGIDVIRHKVKDFARTRTISPIGYRIIILDESDNLTSDAQQALRRTMEAFTSVSRFILIANFSSRIIEPLQSRCAIFRFKSLSEGDIKKYIDRIVKGEKLKISKSAIDAIIDISEGDLRKVANLLQASSVLGKRITEDVIYDVSSKAKPTDVKEMLELSLGGRFDEARKKLQDMLLRQGLSGEDVIREIHKQIYSLDIGEEEKVRLVEICGEYEYRLSQGSSDLLQLEALLAQFLSFSKSK
jgi:replication factor C small subunit